MLKKKVRQFVLLATCITATVAVEEGVQQTGQQLYEHAMKHINNGKYDEAERLLKEIVDDKESNDPKIVAQAAYALGEYIAITRDHDYKKAIKTFELIIELRDKAPQVANITLKRLGDMFSWGSLQVPRDIEVAIRYYELLAEQNHDRLLKVYAYLRLGDVYRAATSDYLYDAAKSFQYYLRASKQEDDYGIKMQALLNLGEMTSIGEGQPKDFDRTVKFYEEVANQKKVKRARAKAYYELGCIFFMDIDEDFKNKLDIEKGLKYFHLAAEQNDDRYVKGTACQYLAKVYFVGKRGVQQDTKKALGFLELLANKDIGNPGQQNNARRALGDVYRYGVNSVPVDKKKAAYYYKKVKPLTKYDYDPELEECFEWAAKQ